MKHKWWGLAALIPALAMVFTDQSVLPVALPTIQKQLGATNIELEWSVNAYLLITAILVLAGGKVGDWIGHRKAFTWGMIVFAVSSALCGVSPDAFFLIAARALQGVGAALMFPASTALLMSLFPPQERGRATGINVSISSLFIILGPLIGGYFTQVLSWRWIFWVNLPLCVLGLILVFLFIPKSPKGEKRFDMPGFLFFVAASSALITVLMQGREWGWTSLSTVTLSLICLGSACLLFWREKSAKHPFLELPLFRHPVYKAVNITVFAIQFIMMISVFRAVYFQTVMGLTPLKAGLITVISSVPILFVSPLGGMLSDKLGPKIPIAIGFLLLIFSFFWLAAFHLGTVGEILPGLFAMGIGIPFVFTPSYASAMVSIPASKAGIGFGTIATIRSLGATFGMAVLGLLIDGIRYRTLRTELKGSALDQKLLEGLALGDPDAQVELQRSFPDMVASVAHELRQADIQAFIYSHLTLACLLIVAFGAVFVLYHRKSTHHLPETPSEGWD